MALIPLPTVGTRDITWEISDPSISSRSIITQRTKILMQPGTRFSAKVDLSVQNAVEARAWKRFFTALKGRVNTFELPAVKPGEQATVTPATVAIIGGPYMGASIVTAGWARPSPAVVMQAGMTISHAGRLHVVQADVLAGAAEFGADPNLARIFVGPEVDVNTIATAAVRVASPVGTMRITGATLGWADLLENYQPLSFTCEEAF
ncbi:hypothetical protein GCM10007973_33110 [Polymorphobacter multimanifer]|uniref:Uncharacterized protein n=1 Tax=Polymorphobacter multimanifer TaxID=1070431 RepID=A0A841L9Q1_9SPHN|nr:hypothetical protein [Polymorphobacter multimanifer]MBB6228361.1 hypothetical protein [Polymorphobacter multimanifer]GGI94383.1 hypothetical protein GCM10007973_33110 [Polymorphobacter multimanifer]